MAAPTEYGEDRLKTWFQDFQTLVSYFLAHAGVEKSSNRTPIKIHAILQSGNTITKFIWEMFPRVSSANKNIAREDSCFLVGSSLTCMLGYTLPGTPHDETHETRACSKLRVSERDERRLLGKVSQSG